MRKTPWALYVWPGLPQIWAYGNWSGLFLALAAAVAFDVVLLVSFGWTELIGQSLRTVLWVVFGVGWAAAIGWSVYECRRQTVARFAEPKEDSFGQALDHYLKGDSYEAEQILEGLLRRNARDLDARLMLATVLRRAGRLDEATQQLDALSCFEDAIKWEVEMQEERDLLAEAKTKNAAAA